MKAYQFSNFYTTKQPVQYKSVNKLEGKSNYNSYHPTGLKYEQQMEQYWIDGRNKELAEKRRDEEA